MLRLFFHWLIIASSILLTAQVVPGIRIAGWQPALIAALVLGVLNAIMKPILVILTLPLTVLTLGLFLLVINATILSLAGYIVPGFEVRGFWAAVFGAVLISICTTAGDALLDRLYGRRQQIDSHLFSATARDSRRERGWSHRTIDVEVTKGPSHSDDSRNPDA